MIVLFRGSSISAGYGVNTSYVKMIQENWQNSNYIIINSSNYKETSFDGIWDFDEKIAAYRPDILVLHFAIDDAYFPVYRSEFKENLVQIVRLAKEQFNSKILLLTSHPFENPYEMDMINIYYRSIREVAMDIDCFLLPVHFFWLNYLYANNFNIQDFLLDDTRYPNEKGHEIYYSAVMNKLLTIVNN